MKDKINKIIDNKKLLFIIITIYGLFITCFQLIPSYNCDGLCQLSSGFKEYSLVFFRAGRYLTGAFWYIFSIIKMPHDLLSVLSIILSIIFLTYAVIKLFYKIREYINSKDIIINLIIVFGSLFIVYNPFTLEFFQYEESFCMCLGLMLSLCAAINIVSKKYFISLLELLLVVCLYQGTLGVFGPTMFFLSVLKERKSDLKTFIKNNIVLYIISASYYIGVSITNVALMKILDKVFASVGESKVAGYISIKENYDIICKFYELITDSYNDFTNPKVFNFIVNLSIVLGIGSVIENYKKNSKYLIYHAILLISCIIFAFGPNLIMETESNYMAPRIILTLTTLVGFSILSLLNYDNNKNINKFIINITFSFSILFFIINSYYYFDSSLISYKRYKKDIESIKVLSEQIDPIIKEYDIEYVQIQSAKSSDAYYDENIKNLHSYKLVDIPWATGCALQYYRNDSVDYRYMDQKKYKKYMEQYDSEENSNKDFIYVIDDKTLLLLIF